VPSLAEGERLDHWWMEVTDDLGTTYNHNQTGAYGLGYGGSATIGSRDLRGRRPLVGWRSAFDPKAGHRDDGALSSTSSSTSTL
jgi:hypothetical protein